MKIEQKEKNYSFSKEEIEQELRKIIRKKCTILQLEIDEKSGKVLFIVEYFNKTKQSLELSFFEIERLMKLKGGKIFHIQTIATSQEHDLKIRFLVIQNSIWNSEHRLIINQIINSMNEILEVKANITSIRYSIQKKKKSNEYQAFLKRLASQNKKNVKDNLELLDELKKLVRIICNKNNSNKFIIDLITINKEKFKTIQQQLK